MEPGKHKILVYRPLFLWMALLLLASLLPVSGYLLFERGRLSAGQELKELHDQRKAQEKRVETQQETIRTMRERVTVLERAGEIDRRAATEVRDEYAALQNELSDTRQELDFYRSILSPGDVKPGLRLHHVVLEPTSVPEQFRYRVTLTQVKRNDRYLNGKVTLQVDGVREGLPQTLTADALGVDKPLNYRFRYFQHFRGKLVVPEGFEPRVMKVRVVPRGKKSAAIEQFVAWPM